MSTLLNWCVWHVKLCFWQAKSQNDFGRQGERFENFFKMLKSQRALFICTTGLQFCQFAGNFTKLAMWQKAVLKMYCWVCEIICDRG